ncbi:MAG: hypothetical protein K2Q25_07995 [Mycobacteriaceae bacterium]|nr:hypothetical protein [Mycobacteriaceae bacterium]
MLTEREQAASLYGVVRGMRSSRPRGADMSEVTRGRLARLDQAAAAIASAIGTPRILVREPSDPQLTQMGEHVNRIRASISQGQR